MEGFQNLPDDYDILPVSVLRKGDYMKALGSLPKSVPAADILQSIGENILIADKSYNVVWMNPAAASLLSHVAPLFGVESVEEIIGMNMSTFHKAPSRQENIMQNLTSTHRARIHIKDKFVADIIITPVFSDKEIKAYIVMLMDVTTMAEEERRREGLIKALSVPIMRIWDNAIAIPLFGDFDLDRGELLLNRVLQNTVENRIHYVLVDVSGLTQWNTETGSYIKKLGDSLKLIGAECYIAGMTPEAAMSFSAFNFNYPTFSNIQSGLIHVLEKERNSNN
jgi:rsbT co-antagonist protein RsbR